MPTTGMNSANRASDGIVRNTPLTASAIARAVGRFCTAMPSDTENTVARTTTIRVILACCQVAVSISLQWSPT